MDMTHERCPKCERLGWTMSLGFGYPFDFVDEDQELAKGLEYLVVSCSCGWSFRMRTADATIST